MFASAAAARASDAGMAMPPIRTARPRPMPGETGVPGRVAARARLAAGAPEGRRENLERELEPRVQRILARLDGR